MAPLERLISAGELAFIGLLFVLFVVPRALQRFRLPTAVTSFGLGAAAALGPGWFLQDPTVQLLATFGIVSLFLFAGLEVDLQDIRDRAAVILQHLALRLAAMAAVTAAVVAALHLPLRPSVLICLALTTPSTGFILDSIRGFDVSDDERFWIRSKAVATELLALAILFVSLQSVSWPRLGISAAVLAAMVFTIPLLFRAFASMIVPHAPRSEFAFLIMVAVVCASVTRGLGVYYLVGAFLVGMAADRFRERLPAIASEKMLHAVEAFASIFVPFYFFHAGMELRPSYFQLRSLAVGAAFLVVMVPLRIALVALHRRISLRERFRVTLRIGVPILPTLVFGLVIVGILRERYAVPNYVIGGLVIYTIATTLIPGFWMRTPPPEFDTPEVPPLRAAGGAGDAGGSQGGRR